MNSSDISEYSQASAEIMTDLKIIGEIFSRTKLAKSVFIDELLVRVETELGVKLVREGESKKREVTNEQKVK